MSTDLPCWLSVILFPDYCIFLEADQVLRIRKKKLKLQDILSFQFIAITKPGKDKIWLRDLGKSPSWVTVLFSCVRNLLEN